MSSSSLWIDTPQPVVEKNGASLVFTVRLTAPITQAVTVSYATVNGTAFANKNYRSTKGTLTFGPGKPLVQTIKVPVLDDRKYGDNVSFVINLSPKRGSIPIAQGSASGTILEGDPMPKLSIENVTVHQGPSGTSKATFTVTLWGATTKVTTVDYATADGTSTVADHDYQASSGMLSFSPGVTTKTITVLVNADPTYEPPETFQVRLSNSSGATLSRTAGTATIINTSPKQKAKSQNVVILRRSPRIVPLTQRRTGGDLVDSAIRALMEG
jgi:Calx-beta domain